VQLYIDGNKEEVYELLTRRFYNYDIQKDTLNLCNAVIRGHRLELFPMIVPSGQVQHTMARKSSTTSYLKLMNFRYRISMSFKYKH
jgi:hypothetical protein